MRDTQNCKSTEPVPMPARRVYIYLGIAVLIIAGGLILRFTLPPPEKAGEGGITVVNKGSREVKGATPPSIGGPFTLISHEGKLVSESDFRGTNMFIFFGYTNCPDVCPLTLNNVSRGLALLGEDAKKIQPLFISLDPLRDTPEAMKDYLQHFDKRFVGLTGTTKQVAVAQRAYRIFVQKRDEDPKDSNDYLLDHTSVSYMMGPNGEFKTFFSNGSTPEEFAAKMKEHL